MAQAGAGAVQLPTDPGVSPGRCYIYRNAECKSYGVIGGFLPRFQRASKAMQCIAESEALDGTACEVVKVKLKFH